MSENEAWAAYFYPGTQILRNKLGIEDARIFDAERFLVTRRSEQLYAGYADIPRTLDLDHLRAIHKYLFQDVYDFAGELRTVSIGKKVEQTDETRWFLRPQDIEPWFAQVGQIAREVPWSTLTREDLVHELAELHSYLNLGHGFREGNGRSARVFLDHVLERTDYTLDFSKLSADEWNEASRDSIRPGKQHAPEGPLLFEPQERIFEKLVVQRHESERPDAAAVAALERAQRDFPVRQTLGVPTPTRSRWLRPVTDKARDTDLGR